MQLLSKVSVGNVLNVSENRTFHLANLAFDCAKQSARVATQQKYFNFSFAISNNYKIFKTVSFWFY